MNSYHMAKKFFFAVGNHNFFFLVYLLQNKNKIINKNCFLCEKLITWIFIVIPILYYTKSKIC